MRGPNYSAFDLSADNFFFNVVAFDVLCAETDHGASDDSAAATAADNDDDESGGGGGGDSVNHARGKKREEVNVASHKLSAI